MQIKVEIPEPDGVNIPDSDRKVVQVEHHARRNETFHVLKNDQIMEGASATVFNLRPGDRLVITTPNEDVAPVFDQQQNAAVRPAQQSNGKDRADRPGETPNTPAPQMKAPETPLENPAPTQGQNAKPKVQTTQAPQPKVATTQSGLRHPPGTPAGQSAPNPAPNTNSPSPGTTSPANQSGTQDSKDVKHT